MTLHPRNVDGCLNTLWARINFNFVTPKFVKKSCFKFSLVLESFYYTTIIDRVVFFWQTPYGTPSIWTNSIYFSNKKYARKDRVPLITRNSRKPQFFRLTPAKKDMAYSLKTIRKKDVLPQSRKCAKTLIFRRKPWEKRMFSLNGRKPPQCVNVHPPKRINENRWKPMKINRNRWKSMIIDEK